MSFTAPGFLQKKWFLALFIALIIVLIVESSLIVFFVLASSLGRQVFPSIDLSYHLKPSCSTLVPTIVATTANNRTLEYSCPGQGALYMPISCPFWGCGPADCCGANSVLVKPEFSLPPGYLSLSLVNTDLGTCTSRYVVSLETDQNLTLGGEIVSGNRLNYDYCAIIAGQTGTTLGFTIAWYEVSWPGICCVITSFPSQITIPDAVNASATITITVTPINKFFGNVSFSAVGGGSRYTGWTWRFDPNPIVVKPGSSSSTTVTIVLLDHPAPQTFTLDFTTYPNRYYTGVMGSITATVP